MEEIENIYKAAINDPEIFSQIDMDKLMDSIENEKNQYLENKKTTHITKEIIHSMDEYDILPELRQQICAKLVGYRFVDEIYQLHKGKHVRWIKKSDILNTNNNTNTNNSYRIPQLHKGGIVVEIKFQDNGIYIICRLSNTAYIIKYKYDDCLTYQKLSTDEQLILLANNYIHSDS